MESLKITIKSLKKFLTFNAENERRLLKNTKYVRLPVTHTFINNVFESLLKCYTIY